MGFFDFLQRTDINEGLKKYKETANAILLDVRTPEEYSEGRIPESKNLPLQLIENISSVIPDKNAPVFVYCRSGARSRQAMLLLKREGYTAVTDLGGILSYQGEIIK